MRARGADEQSTGQFAAHFQAVAAGALGTIPEDSIVPLDALPAMPTDEVDDDRAAAALRCWCAMGFPSSTSSPVRS